MAERTNNTRKTDSEKERLKEEAAMIDRTRKKNAKDNGKLSMKERRKKSRDVEIPDDGVPYDRGWAWMIALAGFINFVIAAGYNRAIFIFFVNFLEEFNAPVTETALLFGVKAGINSVVGLFIMNAVVGRFGVRKTVFVGGVCISLSAILGSFANDITSLILSQAVFHGLGMSMLNMPTTVLLGFYFKRRRSLANSITKCGVGVGAVAFPPIATFLLDQFGLRGALILMGAICLNSLVAALLLRPTSFFQKRRRQSCDGDASEQLLGDDDSAADRADQKAGTTENETRVRESKINSSVEKETNCHPESRENGNPASDPKIASNGCVVVIEKEGWTELNSDVQTHKQTWIPPFSFHAQEMVDISKSAPNLNKSTTDHRDHRRTSSFSGNKTLVTVKNSRIRPSHHVLDALSQSSVVRYMSAPDLELDTPCVLTTTDHHHHTQRPMESSELAPSRTCLRTFCHVAGKVVSVLDFRLFHSPMFRLMVVFFITSPMVHSVSVYLPAMASERGLDQGQSAVLLSIIGGLDFCCRLASGFIADLKIVKVSTMIGTAFFILGLVCQLTRFMTSFSLLIGLAVAQGLLGGVAACMMPILIMEDIGLEDTAKALGFNKLFSGAAMAAFHPLLGYIRDSTGSYDVAYNVIGTLTLLSAVVIMCLRFLPHTLPPSRDLHVTDLQESSPLNQKSDGTLQTIKTS